MADVANGALQFSMRMTDPQDPRLWPEALDVERIRTFLHGYDSAGDPPLSAAERAALPWLMLEALVIESVIPIAATGCFGPIAGSRFLVMVERKVGWLRPRAEKLVRFLEQTEG